MDLLNWLFCAHIRRRHNQLITLAALVKTPDGRAYITDLVNMTGRSVYQIHSDLMPFMVHCLVERLNEEQPPGSEFPEGRTVYRLRSNWARQFLERVKPGLLDN